MQIKYISQPHQTKAINSIVNLFSGQVKQTSEYDIFEGEAVCSNNFSLDADTILENLVSIQKQNNIKEVTTTLESLDFSVEMETGTGKTYVYIKTILELFKKYGWNKFIIITPSIAIREGVLNSLASMQNHFKSDFNFPYEYFEYDSSRLGSLKHFIRDDNLQIMIMTIDSFKRANTILNMTQEGFVSSPKNSLQKTKPILILDEPQNMESELSKVSLNELNPLFTLRFSATHKNYYNLLYTLSPKESLAQGLVKEIDVWALSENQTINDVYIDVLKIEIDKKSKRPVASLELIVKNRDEFIKKTVKIKGDDSLKDKTKNPIYTGFLVDEISFKDMFIQFENGLKLDLHEINGKVNKQIQQEQISDAIKLHMEKFEELKKKDIKVLSLFFIDRVANFLSDEDGWMQEHFCKEFDRLKVNFESFKTIDSKEVYSYYFAKRKTGFVDELKNSDSDRKLQKQTYDLIMKSKEKLLSFEEKTSFIFSHSALKEGWDNPNVFFITTLNDTKSSFSKRQILGRGVRLPVDKYGQRIEDKNINRLTVIVNESFEEFARELQIQNDAIGVNSTTLNNVKKDKKYSVMKTDWLEKNREFLELWEKIKSKTIFELTLDTGEYKKQVIKKLKTIETREKKILKQFGNVHDGYISDEKNIRLDFEEVLPDLVGIIEKSIGISRKTIIEILEEVNLKPFVNNSDEYIKKALLDFDDAKHNMLIDGIEYKKVDDDFYEFKNIFPTEQNGYDLQECKKGLYTLEQYDSEIEKEFIKCTDNNNFKIFTKLPTKFKIKTPLGNYNPDFAVIKFDESEGSFIVETKGSEKDRDLRGVEAWKIAYAKKHFELLDVKYRDKVTDCKKV
ncbi:MAG: DEAD/DEAH box helicase family protein [Sulfurimonas sp.]|nr:DEAD/DEAH box helicase family protein [Sulfurimonas sp.]